MLKLKLQYFDHLMWRTDAFELWCWRRLLRVPWTARRSNQSILKEISPEHSLQGLLLKLKLQYSWHLMQRTDSLEKTLMLGKTESGTIKKAEGRRIDAFKLWCWRKLLSPLDCKETTSVNPKGNQSWMFIGRTDAETETPILWPPDAKKWLIWKDPDAGKDWRWEEKGMTEDEMVGWHHWLNGHEFE